MNPLQAIATAWLGQLTGPVIISILSVIIIFGIINELLAWREHVWQWVLRAVLWGSFAVGAAAWLPGMMGAH
jgi:predicted cation transporter